MQHYFDSTTFFEPPARNRANSAVRLHGGRCVGCAWIAAVASLTLVSCVEGVLGSWADFSVRSIPLLLPENAGVAGAGANRRWAALCNAGTDVRNVCLCA